ncbi:glycosyl hydrolase family 28 protein [Paenibacillus oryzisoli]|uniref:glycosyl hydrolase family 28 protein n=1 Tax=Paenibacillus oryzisoli TaxID=1850517 RepID=UPI003D2E3BCB
MEMNEGKLKVYSVPREAVGNSDFTARVRLANGEWKDLFTYEVRVDMHDVRSSSMAAFDFEGAVEVEIVSHRAVPERVEIRPNSSGIVPEVEGRRIWFKLDKPSKLSIEVNGERFHNLHLFAGEVETDAPQPESPGVVVVQPGTHSANGLIGKLKASSEGAEPPSILYFAEGFHCIEDGLLPIPSDTTVYIAGGAIVVGSMLCRQVENVVIRGRGMIYLRDIEKTTYWRSVQIDHSKQIEVEGIISVDPPHYSIHLGQSERVKIRNFKSFSTRGWCDGIDMMSCTDIDIDDVFLRTSDDCIAIYGSRGAFKGDTRSIRVRNSILWADVAHPINIGCHGDHELEGDVIADIQFDQIDILEHHEPQDGYWGCMSINVGDRNTVRNVSFRNVRVEPFELGRPIDIRVLQNEKYNPCPGNAVRNITFENISFDGECDHPSVIGGYDERRTVEGVTFRNLRMNGRLILSPEEGNFAVGPHAHRIVFEA